MKKKFLEYFQIILYNDSDSIYYNQILNESLNDSYTFLSDEIAKFDNLKNGYINLSSFKRILDKLQTKLDNEIIEYLIYIMKKSSYEDPILIYKDNEYIPLLHDLKYSKFLDIIKENTTSPKINRLTQNDLSIKNSFLIEVNNKDKINNINDQHISEVIFDSSCTNEIYKNIMLKISDLIINENFGNSDNEKKLHAHTNNKLIINQINYFSCLQYFLFNKFLTSSYENGSKLHSIKDSEGYNLKGFEPQKIFEILHIEFSELEKIIFTEQFKIKFDNLINLEEEINKRTFDLNNYLKNNFIDYNKLILELFEIFFSKLNEEILNNNFSNNHCEFENVKINLNINFDKNHGENKIHQVNSSEKVQNDNLDLNLKNTFLLEIIDFESLKDYKEIKAILIKNLYQLINNVSMQIAYSTFKEVENELISIGNFEKNEEMNLDFQKIIIVLNNISEIIFGLKLENYKKPDTGSNFIEIFDLLKAIILIDCEICNNQKVSNNNYDQAFINFHKWFLLYFKKNVNIKNIYDTIKESFLIFKIFFSINNKTVQNINNNSDYSLAFTKNESEFMQDKIILNIIELKKNFKDLSNIIDNEMLRNDFQKKENIQQYNFIFNMAIKDIFETKISLENLWKNLFEINPFDKLKNFQKVIPDKERFLFLINVFMNINEEYTESITQANCFKNEKTKNIEKLFQQFNKINKKISLKNLINFCKHYSIFQKEYILLSDFPSNKYFDNHLNQLHISLEYLIDLIYPKVQEIKILEKKESNLSEKDKDSKSQLISKKESNKSDNEKCTIIENKEDNIFKDIKKESAVDTISVRSLQKSLSNEKEFINSQRLSNKDFEENYDYHNKTDERTNPDNLILKNNENEKINLAQFREISNEENSISDDLLVNKIKLFIKLNYHETINNFERLIFLTQFKIKVCENRRFIFIKDFYEFMIEKEIIEENFLEYNLKGNFSRDNLEDNFIKILPPFLIQDHKVDLEELKNLVENLTFEEKIENFNIESKNYFDFIMGEILKCN